MIQTINPQGIFMEELLSALRMRSSTLSILVILLYVWLNPIHGQEAQPKWKQEIQNAIDETNSAVREAFLKGDLATIAKYHHPEVTKALAFDNIVNNREEVIEGLRQTMSQFDMAFMDDRKTEKIHIRKDMVMMQAQFALKLTPKNGDPSFVYRGRTLLVYVPCPESPTGWGTLHEIIQPGQ